ncbi:Hsp20/alpha crystallin family protein [Ostertagia ostertagi]
MVFSIDGTFQIVNDDKKFAVSLDVSQFKPEELKVNLDGRMLTVEGKQENKNGQQLLQNDTNCYKRIQVTTRFQAFYPFLWSLPEDVNLEGLKTELSDKGKLTIEAPKFPNTSKKDIPIQHGSSFSQSQSTHSYSRSSH